MTTTTKLTNPRGDLFSLSDWAEEQVSKHIRDVRSYIDSGWEPAAAVQLVLDGSCIGDAYKARVRAHFGA